MVAAALVLAGIGGGEGRAGGGRLRPGRPVRKIAPHRWRASRPVGMGTHPDRGRYGDDNHCVRRRRVIATRVAHRIDDNVAECGATGTGLAGRRRCHGAQSVLSPTRQ
jgi:hypothetical protein